MVHRGIFIILLVFLSFSFVSSANFGYNILEPTPCVGNQVRVANGQCVDVTTNGTTTSTGNGTGKAGQPPFLFNNTNTIFYNDTLLNATIDQRAGPSTNVFNQDLNTTDDVTFANLTVTTNITSGFFNGLFNWTLTNVAELYMTFTGGVLDFNEVQLNTTIDDRLIQNETNRLQNITTYDCPSGEFVTGFQNNGTVICSIDTGGGNIFDQDLNTTNNVVFANLTVTTNTTSGFFNGLFNWVINLLDSSPAYLTFNGSTLSFDESQLNTTIDDRLIQNETVRFQNLTTYNCQGANVFTGVALNGTGNCTIVEFNFNQSNIQFNFNQSNIQFNFNQSDIEFNFNQSNIQFNFNQSNIEFNFNQSNIEFNFNQSNIEFNFNQSIANETNRLQNLTTYNCQGANVFTGVALNGTGNCTAVEFNFNQSNIEFNFNQSNIEFNFNQSIANETNRLQNITTYDCPSNQFATGFQDNGTIICSGSPSSNPFDQDLNTTSGVTFATLNVSGQTILGNITAFIGNILFPQANLHINGTVIFGENRSEVELDIGDVLVNSLALGQNITLSSTDGSGDLIFQDDNAGILTLSELAAGGGGGCTQSNSIISGGNVVWSLSDLIFHVSPTVYCIGGLQFETTTTIDVTLDAANSTFDRFDIIVVNVSNTAGFVKGVPATDPLVPTPNAATELKLSEVLIQAGATEPGNETGGGVAFELIYDEQDGQDWTGQDNTGGSVNFTASGNPSNGTVHIDTESPLDKNSPKPAFQLNDPTTFDPTTITTPILTLEIEVQVAWNNKDKLNLQFLDSGGANLGSQVVIQNGAYGFDASNTASYQILIIPLSDFGTLGTSVKSLAFTAQPFKNLNIDFFIDFIRITGTSGGGSPPSATIAHGELSDLQTTSGQRANPDHDPRYLAKIVTSLQNFEGRLIFNNSAFTPLTIEDGFGGITLNVSNILLVDNANKRVGIGTDTPGNILHTLVTSASNIFIQERVDTSINPGNVLGGIEVHAGESDSTAVVGKIEFEADETWTGSTSGSRFILSLTSNGSTTSSEKLRVLESGFVGIGTTTPSSLLTISQNQLSGVNFTLQQGDASINANNILSRILFTGIDSDVRTGAMIIANVTSGWGTNVNDAPTDLQFFTQSNGDSSSLGSPRMVITSDGFVGIGVIDPQFLLHISTDLNQVASFNSSDDSSIITIRDDDTQAYISVTDSLLSLGGLAGDQAANLNINTSNGFVGIGTISPVTEFNVLGVQTISRHSDNAGANTLDFRKSRGTEASPTIISDNDNVGILDFFAFDGVDYASRAANIGVRIDGTPGENDLPGLIYFSTTADGDATATERMVIDSQGFVGIGFSEPTERFQVSGGAVILDGKGVDLNKSGSAVLTISAQTNTNAPSVMIGGVASEGFSAGGVLALNRNSAGSWEALLHYLNANILQWRVGMDSDGTNDYVIQDASENDAINIVDKGTEFEVQIGGNLTTAVRYCKTL